MYTVKDVAELTHLTSRQVYDRLTALSPVLNGTLRTGSRGAKLLSDEGFAVFRRLIDLEDAGHSRESAITIIQGDLESIEQNRAEPIRNDGEGEGNLIAILRERVASQEATILEQREQIRFLRGQVEHLTPLALPKPRKSFLSRFFKPLVIASKTQ